MKIFFHNFIVHPIAALISCFNSNLGNRIHDTNAEWAYDSIQEQIMIELKTYETLGEILSTLKEIVSILKEQKNGILRSDTLGEKMNERIKELYIQTAEETAEGKEWAIGGMQNAERFAELIVEECADILDKQIMPPNAPLSVWLGHKLKEHFGVGSSNDSL